MRIKRCRSAAGATRASGSAAAFAISLLVVAGWAASGPLFGFSETWQLVINTATTVVTFLMVFLIQHAQNKDSVALHLKLNELIASQRAASNRLVAVEDLDEREAFILEQRRIYEEDVDLLRLGSELVIDAVVQWGDLRAEITRRLSRAAGKTRVFSDRRHGVPPV